ncbi:hypothetical protein CPB84DRAFT_1783308 [Gymnopilus junonius]|uniref:Uncharacterized protein n=1 Tax=Gymnopilus junonius TaxID=109634 RepID=A0A9P5NMB0_GYMJU|nr:hypothetical protein CPB84DRAFT_1783308 [Gymnopilus junonius]
MKFSALFTSIALIVAFTSSINADTIVPFSGSTCDGVAGSTVQCDGSCHLFGGRHSVKISGSSTHCVTYFENSSCEFMEAQGGTDIVAAGAWQNVNTGGPVGSFICAPTEFCLV